VNDLTPIVPGQAAADPRRGALRAHLRDPLHSTGYLLLLGAGVTSILGFLFWGVAAREYSARVVGLNSAVISAMMLVSGACQLGLNAVLVRYLPTAGGAARALVLRAYALTFAISLVAGAVAAATSALWSPRLGFLGDDVWWFAGFTLATAAWTLFTLQDSVMTGLKSVGWVPLENSAYALLKLALVIALIGAMPFAGPFVAWNAPVVATVLVITWLIFRRLLPRHRAENPDGVVDRAQIVAVARGNYGGTLCSLASTMLLPIMVANALGASETAFFYVPWTISTALLMIALHMTTSLTVQAALDEARLRELTRRAMRLTMALVVALAGLTALVASPFLGAFGADYADNGTTLLRVLAAAAVPNVLVALALAVARVQHRGRMIFVIQAVQCLLVLGLAQILLPHHGIEGVGVAWLVSQVVVAAGVLAGPLRALLVPARRRPA
jgi:O-antigen/teichoic acid export membrane protein